MWGSNRHEGGLMNFLVECAFEIKHADNFCAVLGRKTCFSPLGLCRANVPNDKLKHYVVPGKREGCLRAETMQCSLVKA